MIDRLPAELVAHVASFLSQSDCYHLILTQKFVYESCMHRLYDSIIIDSTNQIFHKELTNFNDVVDFQSGRYKSTVIRSCNGLKHFFRTLQRKERLIHLINYIKVLKLPDHFIEFELANYFKFLFGRLDNLKGCDFQYYSCFINLDTLLCHLPDRHRMVELTGDFTTSATMKKRKSPARHGLINLSQMKALQLDKLCLINFKHSCYTKDLKLPPTLTRLSICKNAQTSFPTNYSLVNSIGIDFNYLQDCFNKYFYNGMTNDAQQDFSSIFNRSASPVRGVIPSDMDLDTVKNLFSPCKGKKQPRLGLKELRFDGITFDVGDDTILINRCNLEKLTKLTVIDCDEIQDSCWLFKMAPHLSRLQELNLDYENFHDIPNLISQISHLQKLYVNISDPEMTWNYLAFFKSLNKHKDLERLILDYSSDCQLKSIPIKILEKKLVKHTNLKKLRITISIKSLSRFIYNVLPHLCHLQFIELVIDEFNIIRSNNSSGSIYIEEMVYDNDDEEYEFDMNKLTPGLLSLSKIKAINRQILEVCPTLHYTKLFNVLLTRENFVKERGLESWFSEKLL